MFTFIRMLSIAVGGEILLEGSIFCLVAVFVIAFLIKSNRSRINGIITAAGITLSAAVGDLCLYMCFFSDGEYVNKSITSVGYLAIYPLCLLIGLIAVTFINKSKKK